MKDRWQYLGIKSLWSRVYVCVWYVHVCIYECVCVVALCLCVRSMCVCVCELVYI